MALIFITGNDNKAREAEQILETRVIRHKFDLAEIQGTAQEIAEAKIAEARPKVEEEFGSDVSFFVDDVSLELAALGGFPGPYIKDFLAVNGNEGIFKVCNRMHNHNAVAVCAIGLYTPKGGSRVIQAYAEGRIVKPTGEGFGWDPVFRPSGYDQTYAQMPANLKNRLSHRAQALELLKQELQRDLLRY
jgi:inosine triphosphate pyrophosphatase